MLVVHRAVFIWVVAFPIGIFSAVRKYSIGDYLATFLGFIGLAVPNFLLALVLMYVSRSSSWHERRRPVLARFVDAPWSWAKLLDLAQHLAAGDRARSSGIAALVRIMRANLLDELYKPYVTTARAKGLRSGG